MLKQASATSPLVKLGPAEMQIPLGKDGTPAPPSTAAKQMLHNEQFARILATTEKPNDEQGLDEKTDPGDSAEEPSTSKIPEVSHYASTNEETIEILSDDTDDEIEILQENIQKKK